MYDNRFHCYEEVLSMSYPALEKQLQSLPEEYYEEVSHYVEYLLFRQKNGKKKSGPSSNESFFGSIRNIPDGMTVQEAMRNEWA